MTQRRAVEAGDRDLAEGTGAAHGRARAVTAADPSRPSSRACLALDVDGVILDPERGGRGPWQAAFSARFRVDGSRLDETLFTAAWADVITGRRAVESALADAFDELGWDMGVEAALQCWFEEDFFVEPTVMEAVNAWAAQGTPLALVSNQEPRRARFLEQRLAPMLPISGSAFSGDLGAMKKDLDFYDRAERRLEIVGLGPAVVFLDDTLGNVEAAAPQGWTGIHFSKDRDWQSEVADALERARGGPAPLPSVPGGSPAAGQTGGPTNMSRDPSSPTISMSARRRRSQASRPMRKRIVRPEPSRRCPLASPFSS